MIEPAPTRIYYCCGEFQPSFNRYHNVLFHDELPELNEEVFDGREPTPLIVSDLMPETSQLTADIFTKISRYWRVSISASRTFWPLLVPTLVYIMAALCNRTGHYIFALWFLSFFFLLFFPRLISAAADWMSTILRHLVWP